MNKSQKFACFGLIACFIMIGFGINMTVGILSSGSNLYKMMKIWALFVILYFLAFVFFVSKTFIQKTLAPKRGVSEVEFDERDKLVEKRAVLTSLVFMLIALAVASVIPQFIVGQSGVIPAWSLPLINFGVVVFAFIAFTVSILVQYGWKGEKS
jgi:hypothetical protein